MKCMELIDSFFRVDGHYSRQIVGSICQIFAKFVGNLRQRSEFMIFQHDCPLRFLSGSANF